MNTLDNILLVLSTFLCHFLSCGVSYSFGVYYVVILDAFRESYGTTSWMGSLNLGTLCATGPLASYMIDRLGFRVTAQIGGLLASIGILIGSFSPNLLVLFVSFGIITGLGYGLVFTCCVVVIGVSMENHRTLAMGLSIAGIGMGNFAYPFLASHLIYIYGWRGALLITSAFTLHICLFGMFMPGKPPDIENEDVSPITVADSVEILVQVEDTEKKNPHLELLKHQKHTSTLSLDNRANGKIKQPSFMNSHRSLSTFKHHPYGSTEVSKAQSSELMFSLMGRSSSYRHLMNSKDHFSSLQVIARNGPTKSHTDNEIVKKTQAALSTADTFSQIQGDDSDVSILGDDDKENGANKMFAFSLPSYWLLQTNVLLFCLGLSVVVTHISAYAQHQGIHEDQAGILISINGGANVIGRIALGALTQQTFSNTFILYGTCYAIAGAALLVMTVWISFAGLLFSVTIFGLFSAAFGPVLSEATLKVVGVEHFNYGYGFLMISMAIGTTLGAPLAGWLYDASRLYTSSFYFGGFCLIMSSLMMIPVFIANQKARTTAMKTNNMQSNTKTSCDIAISS